MLVVVEVVAQDLLVSSQIARLLCFPFFSLILITKNKYSCDPKLSSFILFVLQSLKMLVLRAAVTHSLYGGHVISLT